MSQWIINIKTLGSVFNKLSGKKVFQEDKPEMQNILPKCFHLLFSFFFLSSHLKYSLTFEEGNSNAAMNQEVIKLPFKMFMSCVTEFEISD